MIELHGHQTVAASLMCDALSDDRLTSELRVQISLIATQVLHIIVKREVLFELLQELCLARG